MVMESMAQQPWLLQWTPQTVFAIFGFWLIQALPGESQKF
jgi:hypothetical protein